MLTASHIEGCISLPANLTLRTVVSTREAILAAIENHGDAVIDVPADSQIDLSFLQLLEAARIQAISAGNRIRLSRPADGALLDALRRSGFLEGMTAEDAQFWLHQGEIQ